METPPTGEHAAAWATAGTAPDLMAWFGLIPAALAVDLDVIPPVRRS